MKTPVLITITCATVLLALRGDVLNGQAGSTWDAYIPRTFQSISDQNGDSARGTDSLFTGDNFPPRITVTYIGQKRALAGKRSEFLVKCFTKARHEPQLAKLFKSEILVREGEPQLWVPIQEPLMPALTSEVTAGAQVTLFAIWLGALRQADKIEWVFTINEFEALGGG